MFTTTTLNENRLPANAEGNKSEKVVIVAVATKESAESAFNPSNLIDDETRDAVEEYFKDEPLLVHIAFCESSFRQDGKNGEVLRGRAVSEDVGVMQINERYHGERAKKLGYDIHTLEGNMGYAKWLYEKEGARPWMSSSKCWTARANHEIALK